MSAPKNIARIGRCFLEKLPTGTTPLNFFLIGLPRLYQMYKMLFHKLGNIQLETKAQRCDFVLKN